MPHFNTPRDYLHTQNGSAITGISTGTGSFLKQNSTLGVEMHKIYIQEGKNMHLKHGTGG